MVRRGVDGSSPSEGSTKAPEIGAFSFRRICSMSNVRCAWSLLWSLQDEKRVGVSSKPLPSRSASPDPDDAEAAIRSVANRKNHAAQAPSDSTGSAGTDARTDRRLRTRRGRLAGVPIRRRRRRRAGSTARKSGVTSRCRPMSPDAGYGNLGTNRITRRCAAARTKDHLRSDTAGEGRDPARPPPASVIRLTHSPA